MVGDVGGFGLGLWLVFVFALCGLGLCIFGFVVFGGCFVSCMSICWMGVLFVLC